MLGAPRFGVGGLLFLYACEEREWVKEQFPEYKRMLECDCILRVKIFDAVFHMAGVVVFNCLQFLLQVFFCFCFFLGLLWT